MLEENKIVNGLWIGNKLSALELLTLHSFTDCGHTFYLWVYDELKNDLPENVILKDANDIIDRSGVFTYPKQTLFQKASSFLADRGVSWLRPTGLEWGHGSYAGFSDVFRYKLLFEQGGWWVDMDVTCLKPFDINGPYFFRDHWQFPAVGNVMKCPIGSILMKVCYEKAKKEVDENNTDWHRPIQILNEEIHRLSLEKYISKNFFNADVDDEVLDFCRKEKLAPAQWMGIHWINSSNRKKLYPSPNTLHTLLSKYNLTNVE